jgi:acetyl-CoA carboxylase biotin carboxyl carrier protein
MSKFDVNEDAVRKLAGLLEEMDLSEIEYERGGERIRVARTVGLPPSAFPASPTAAAVSATAEGIAKPDDAVPDGAITSPMVGTVYTAPEPGAADFVKVGDRVEEGQTLLIIEAMKVMNPLPSPRTGQVTRILVNNGEPVEYGEPLLVIE